MLNIGDLIVLEIALLQFMDKLDLSVEAGRQCSSTLGKLEMQIGQLSASAGSVIPTVVAPGPGGSTGGGPK